MGSVYILENQKMPGLIKVGRTRGLASKVARRLTRNTGISEPFQVAYEVRCEDADELEQELLPRTSEIPPSGSADFMSIPWKTLFGYLKHFTFHIWALMLRHFCLKDFIFIMMKRLNR